MKTISNKQYRAILKEIGVSYIGATRQSAKMRYSYNAKVETYCLYLAPANMSGYEVCANSKFCRDFCLNGSGRNKGDIISRGEGESRINTSRIKKTRYFFEHKEKFMQAILFEINVAMRHAENNGLGFAIRLNGTSDISPEDFVLNGKNILELLPNIQFYDYTKISSRFPLQQKYSNYDLTYSYNGYNWRTCEQYLNQGGKVAVVFENELPVAFKGFKVHDANGYDMRYLDPAGYIMGLHYHRTANDYKSGHYVRPNSRFIVAEDDTRCAWAFKEVA